MEVVYAYLANYAEFSPEGRLTMVGGDLESIISAEFPSRPIYLALAVKAIFSAGESARAFQCRVEIIRAEINQPDGERIQPTIDATLNLPPIIGDSNTARANIAGQFMGVTFPEEGQYFVRILIDGQEKKRIPLRLIRQPPATA